MEVLSKAQTTSGPNGAMNMSPLLPLLKATLNNALKLTQPSPHKPSQIPQAAMLPPSTSQRLPPLHRGSGRQMNNMHHPATAKLQILHGSTGGLDRNIYQQTATWYWAICARNQNSTRLTANNVANGLIGRHRTRRNSVVHALARPQRTPADSSSRKATTQAMMRGRVRHLIVMITVPAVREDACSKTQPVRLERRRRAS